MEWWWLSVIDYHTQTWTQLTDDVWPEQRRDGGGRAQASQPVQAAALFADFQFECPCSFQRSAERMQYWVWGVCRAVDWSCIKIVSSLANNDSLQPAQQIESDKVFKLLGLCPRISKIWMWLNIVVQQKEAYYCPFIVTPLNQLIDYWSIPFGDDKSGI